MVEDAVQETWTVVNKLQNLLLVRLLPAVTVAMHVLWLLELGFEVRKRLLEVHDLKCFLSLILLFLLYFEIPRQLIQLPQEFEPFSMEEDGVEPRDDVLQGHVPQSM